MCQHTWQKVERQRVSEFYIEVRCQSCGARKFIEAHETEPRLLPIVIEGKYALAPEYLAERMKARARFLTL